MTAFGAVVRAELLLNSKRIVPWVMIALFTGNALLWWAAGPAIAYGWATNSEFYIARNLLGFSFLTLPFFTAVIMGDAVIRDFRARIDPLIFSTPVGTGPYLLGKFAGNFVVLVGCQAAYVLTAFALQALRTDGMLVQPPKLLPYVTHFFVLVIVSHLLLGAVYFTVGALTRNAKAVYALAICFYPVYFACSLQLRRLAPRWRVVLDPLLLSWEPGSGAGRSAHYLNTLAIRYDADLIANRALMVVASAACLALLLFRFRRASPRDIVQAQSGIAALRLSGHRDRVSLPAATVMGSGVGAGLRQLLAAVVVEFRLLRGERSLILFLPLAAFLSVLEQAFYDVARDPSYSSVHAGAMINTLQLFLLGMIVFYTGEAMHRDRELRIEQLLWSTPAPSFVLLFSRFVAVVMLATALIAFVTLTSVLLQVLRGHTPVDATPYLTAAAVILAPSVMVIAAASLLLNVVLRDKYVAYAVSIALAIGLFYLYGQGRNLWWYNPLLIGLWTPTDLTDVWQNRVGVLVRRVYWLVIAVGCLGVAHRFYFRGVSRRTTE